MKIIILLTILFVTISFAKTGKDLVKELCLSSTSKASKQWARVFTKPRKMKKYGIDKLNKEEKELLKIYLMNHAADSDTPEAAGI